MRSRIKTTTKHKSEIHNTTVGMQINLSMDTLNIVAQSYDGTRHQCDEANIKRTLSILYFPV